jgi:hypothetical protein
MTARIKRSTAATSTWTWMTHFMGRSPAADTSLVECGKQEAPGSWDATTILYHSLVRCFKRSSFLPLLLTPIRANRPVFLFHTASPTKYRIQGVLGRNNCYQKNLYSEDKMRLRGGGRAEIGATEKCPSCLSTIFILQQRTTPP